MIPPLDPPAPATRAAAQAAPRSARSNGDTPPASKDRAPSASKPSFTDTSRNTIPASATLAGPPSCPNCETYLAEIKALKRELAKRATDAAAQHTGAYVAKGLATPVTSVTENRVTENPPVTKNPPISVTRVTKKGRGRPISGNALSAAEKQRAYRARKSQTGGASKKG